MYQVSAWVSNITADRSLDCLVSIGCSHPPPANLRRASLSTMGRSLSYRPFGRLLVSLVVIHFSIRERPAVGASLFANCRALEFLGPHAFHSTRGSCHNHSGAVGCMWSQPSRVKVEDLGLPDMSGPPGCGGIPGPLVPQKAHVVPQSSKVNAEDLGLPDMNGPARPSDAQEIQYMSQR